MTEQRHFICPKCKQGLTVCVSLAAPPICTRCGKRMVGGGNNVGNVQLQVHRRRAENPA